MPIRLVSFDCAQTLLEVTWDAGEAATRAAERLGIAVPRPLGPGAYRALLARRVPEYRAANRTGLRAETDAFWAAIGRDWLASLDLPVDRVDEIAAIVWDEVVSPQSPWFRPFEDVVPALEALQGLGYRLVVLSNWDLSLEPVLRAHGLRDYFDAAVASLLEGVEKPEPELFRIALARVGVPPGEAVHVGDSPIDDLMGARSAGLRAILVDRASASAPPGRVRSLTELPEVLRSFD